MIDLDALEALARAATPGPWFADHDGHRSIGGPIGVGALRPWREDAAYFAALSPDVVLSLIERLRAAESLFAQALNGLDACKAAADTARGSVHDAMRSARRAEIEAEEGRS